ncbi:hypothetical protein [Variovorax sp. Sphag1AA]|uniref:hypothetical protein n=1 Tax=Variovorax sp. Sphag1AA TaxID=2587027 RepID=UPI00160D939F|nr:hypothetical protein [Variovorax sp. Sphag1AA]MBB3178521.1 hypothetical protein [Variovorax sp. Sphag1AA]
MVLEAEGDFSVVNGKTVYVILEDPDSLFESQVQAIPFYVNGRGGVMLSLKPKSKGIGTYRGFVSIYACLDVSCSVRLGNTPVKIPYDVVVKRNVRFDVSDSASTSLNVPFSDAPQVVKLTVKPAEGTAISSWEMEQRYASNTFRLTSSSLSDNGNGTGTLTLEIPPAVLPGTYRQPFLFRTQSGLIRELVVDIQVTENPGLPYLVTPTALAIPARIANRDYWTIGRLTLALPRGEFALQGLETLFTPEQQAAIPQGLKFLFVNLGPHQTEPNRFFIDVSATACRIDSTLNPVYPYNWCLPAGTYEFRVKYAITIDGVTQQLYTNGQLIVEP